MKTITIQPNQTTIDAVLMACGTMEAAMQVMAANDQSITEAVDAGLELVYDPATTTTDSRAVQYLQQNSVVIGTKPAS